MELIERYRGSLLGLAVGDALGAQVEFLRPGSFTPVSEMSGGGPHRLKPGQWTDDTSMALCLAESLVERKTFDAKDQMQRYVRWYRSGHLSSTGRCFDIGNTTKKALGLFESAGNQFAGSVDLWSAGNGSIMRLAPVPLCYAANPVEAIEKSGESSRTTHGAIACVDACRYFGALIAGAVNGVTKSELLSTRHSPVSGYWTVNPLTSEIDDVASGSFKRKSPPDIVGSGHVVKSLEAALWAFQCSDTFEQGCLLTVNLGDDADTTAAVYGQLAGAFYGEQGIPERWKYRLAMRDTIAGFAEKLYGVMEGGKQSAA